MRDVRLNRYPGVIGAYMRYVRQDPTYRLVVSVEGHFHS